MVTVAIFDYGVGNILSLKNSMEKAGACVEVIRRLEGECKYAGLLLPGVGHFDPAMRNMTRGPADLREYVGDHTPVLGICLGMEMMFESSSEGTERGLGIMGGSVVELPGTVTIPHMGWNNLEIKKQSRILEGIDDMSWVYYTHSYMARPASDGIILAESDYGTRIPAMVQEGNFVGAQFHPEKSAGAGRTILRNFLEWCRR